MFIGPSETADRPFLSGVGGVGMRGRAAGGPKYGPPTQPGPPRPGWAEPKMAGPTSGWARAGPGLARLTRSSLILLIFLIIFQSFLFFLLYTCINYF